MPTSRAVANGTKSPFTVDAAATELLDSDGVPLLYSFKGGSVNFKGSDPGDDDSDDDSDDDDESEFDGNVTSVNTTAGTLTLSGGQVIAVNASTVWEASGDLFSLADIASALGAGTTVEVEGEGQTQADGSILATEIEAESDD